MMKRFAQVLFVVAVLPFLSGAQAKISELEVVDDPRRLFAVESFGFLVGGVHKMSLEKLKVIHDPHKRAHLILSCPKTLIDPDSAAAAGHRSTAQHKARNLMLVSSSS